VNAFERRHMAIQTIDIKDKETKAMKLSPAPIIPAMSFPISNETGLDIKITGDGKNIRIEKQ
jgi:hypothetical protein